MSDGTNSTDNVQPEVADLSEEPTVASGFHAESDTQGYPYAGDDPALGFTDEEPATDEEDEWPVRAPAKGIRLGIPAALIVAVALVAAGFWGGAIAQKSHAQASAAAGPAAFAARLRNAGGTGANGGFQLSGSGTTTGGSSETTGTISVVNGNTLYVLTATNQLVEVKLNSSTTVTRNAKAKAVELRPGDTVVVQGAAGNGGSVQASSVAATAKGVSATTGGLGGNFPSSGTGGGFPQGSPGG